MAQEQSVACLSCGAAELIRDDSPRLVTAETGARKWPAWEPMLQPFPCPGCGAEMVWATEPREAEEATA